MATAARTHISSPVGDEQLGWTLVISLGLHLLVAAAIIFWPSSEDVRRINFGATYQVNLVAPSALPKAGPPPKAAPKPKAAPEPEAAKPKPQPKPAAVAKPTPKPKEAIGDKKTVKRRKVTKKPKPGPSASQQLEAKLRRMQAKVGEERSLERALSRLEDKVGPAGQGAQAGATAGAFGRAGQSGDMSMRFQVYYAEVWERTRRQWVVPQALVGSTRGQVSIVVIRLRRDGSLEKAWLEQSSGNNRLDQTALRAVERAAPYPPLPAGYREKVLEVGLRFRPEEAGG